MRMIFVAKRIQSNRKIYQRKYFAIWETSFHWTRARNDVTRSVSIYPCEFQSIKYVCDWLKLNQNFTNKYIACWVWFIFISRRIQLDRVYCTRRSVARAANNGNACLRLAYQFGRIKHKIFTFILNNNNHILSIKRDDTKKWRYVGCRRHHRYHCQIAIMKSVKCTNTLALHIRLFCCGLLFVCVFWFTSYPFQPAVCVVNDERWIVSKHVLECLCGRGHASIKLICKILDLSSMIPYIAMRFAIHFMCAYCRRIDDGGTENRWIRFTHGIHLDCRFFTENYVSGEERRRLLNECKPKS